MKYKNISNPHRDLSLNYYDYYRTKIIRDNKPIYGTMFKLEKALTDEQKQEILKYPNTLLYISECGYAREIKSNCILMLDRNIRKKEVTV